MVEGARVELPRTPHRWRLSPSEAVALQRRLAERVIVAPLRGVRRVLGLDCAFEEQQVLAVVVVWDLERRRIIETRGARRPLTFPYVPGLLSFRELPTLIQVMRQVASPVDAVLCDGQGIAHPRRLGIASHLGVITGLPVVGCAKSRLIGKHEVVPLQRGARRALMDRGERIGTVLCTRNGVKPVYVSPGHLVDFDSSDALVLACGGGYRLPEPTRLADRLVAGFKKRGSYRGGLTAGPASERK
jgi:deoxyribonuclease V